MHPFTIPPEISARVAARCGTPHPFATLVGPRTALVVVDMQNAFMDPALGHAVCAMAPAIVPVVNRLATATRAAGGGVFWIQTVHDETDDRDWAVMQAMMTPAARARRVAALTRDSAGYARWPQWKVELNPRLVDFEGQVERTLKHELAHLIAFTRANRRKIEPHGVEWRKACADLGIPDESARHTLPLPRTTQTRNYTYICPVCRNTVARVRKFSKRTACLACCKQHNGGQYDARFQFTLMKE
jgi:predicted SprT family Zn-dependent metalloprotease